MTPSENPAAANAEITLTRGDLRLVVSPYGASLRGLSRLTADGQPEPIITGYSGAAGKVGGQGDVLIPFPGRVGGGRYAFEGRTYQMERNDKDGPNAIHGFLRTVVWDERGRTDDEISFLTLLRAQDYASKGYPFSLRAEVTYRLVNSGLTCILAIENIGDGPAPAAAGFHPYFTVGSPRIDGDLLQVPLQSILEFDGSLIPTGRVLPVDGTPYDFRAARPIGDTQFNTCYLDPARDADGVLRIRLTDPAARRAVTIWMDRTFDYVVLFSGDPLPEAHRRRSLAIEPMTCGSDAFNHPEWGLAVLAPGQVLSGSWGVTAE